MMTANSELDGVTDPDGIPYRESCQPILITDDSARYVAANDAALDLLGYSLEEPQALSIWDLTPPNDHPDGRSQWRHFERQGEDAGFYTLVTRSGQPIEVHYHAIRNVAPGLHLSALTRVSDR